jgi:hypothetical protein
MMATTDLIVDHFAMLFGSIAEERMRRYVFETLPMEKW